MIPPSIWVFLGGGIGSVTRYLFGVYIDSQEFPLHTLTANIVSCFILGLLFALKGNNHMHDDVAILLMTGFCGGFSTFSTFSLEIFQLTHKGDFYTALLYLCISIFVGILAIVLGYKSYDLWV